MVNRDGERRNHDKQLITALLYHSRMIFSLVVVVVLAIVVIAASNRTS